MHHVTLFIKPDGKEGRCYSPGHNLANSICSIHPDPCILGDSITGMRYSINDTNLLEVDLFLCIWAIV